MKKWKVGYIVENTDGDKTEYEATLEALTAAGTLSLALMNIINPMRRMPGVRDAEIRLIEEIGEEGAA